MSEPFRLRDGSIYDPAAIVRKAYADAGVSGEDRTAAEALESQAADWRQRALDGRISGMDPEVRELYLAKASAAEREAKRLKGEDKPKVDEARAAELDQEADQAEKLAADTSLAFDIRRYWRVMARDKREAAEIARGKKIVNDGDGKHLA